LVANFTLNPVNYTITVSASPGAGGTVSGGGTFAGGSSRTVSASANAGYTFANWTENGGVVSSSSSYNFTLNSNRNLVANFTLNPVNYTITVSASPGAGGTVSGGGTFAEGSTRTVTASANSGYTFASWTENGSVVSSSTSYTFTLNANRNLVANLATGVWANLVGVSASGNSLTKTAADGWDNAGAISTATLPFGDGYFEFTANETDKHRMAGLSMGDTNQNYTDIDFAIYLATGGVAWVYESGASKNVYVPYQAGDRFRVAVEGGVVKYRKNGTLFYTSTVLPAYPMLIDTSLHTTGATIADAVLLAGSPNQDVVWANLVGAAATGNSLAKTAADGWGTGGASSTKAIGSGDGYLEFTATETNKHRMCGLGKADTNQDYTEIRFAIYLATDGVAWVYESGVSKGVYTSYQPGNIFRISIEGGVVRYRKNGTLFYTSNVAPVYPLLADASLHSLGATITNAVLGGALVNVGGGGNQLPVANAGGPYTSTPGVAVQFNGAGSTDPDGTIASYAWTFGDGTTGSGATPTHAYATAGTYTVNLTVTDNLGATSSATTTVTITPPNSPQVENLVWTRLVGVSVSGNSLTKVITDGFGNAGASSTRALGSGDGYLEFTATETDKHRMCGLTTVDNTQTYQEIRYAIYLATSGVAWVYEYGVSRNVYVPYQTGDRFRVAIEGGVVKYRKNGTLFFTSTIAPEYPLLVDSSLHTFGSTITNAVLSGNLITLGGGGQANKPPVANPGGPYGGAPGALVQFNGGGSSDPDGAVTNYVWTFGDGTSGLGVAPTHVYPLAGTYTVTLTVTDNQGATASATTTVNIAQGPQLSENVTWINLVGVTAFGNSLTKTAGDGWTNAGASSTKGIAAGDGYVEFTATEINKHRMCGLSNADNNPNYPEIKFAIYLATDGVAWVYESGVSKGVYTPYQPGNVFRVSVAGGVVKYSKNGVVFYTSTVAPAYPLLVDTSLHTTGATITNAVLSGNLQSLVPTLESVIWANAIGVLASGNSLTKTAGDSWTNAGASSTRAIPGGDGYLEFTAAETNRHRMCGLSNGDTNQNYLEIKFAIYLATGGVAWVYESGVSKNVYTNYQPGDTFRISVEGGVVYYKKNGTVFYTSTVAPAYPLLVDASLHTNGATINNAVIFGKF
ncbi:MAG TPA: PKD domain-containing protein, partial [Pyrinomonadaceae bacterium]|nr:PKD domain-containing protein [Pyrinomonadaceae bacterium]